MININGVSILMQVMQDMCTFRRILQDVVSSCSRVSSYVIGRDIGEE
jgi:hypothetical protein